MVHLILSDLEFYSIGPNHVNWLDRRFEESEKIL